MYQDQQIDQKEQKLRATNALERHTLFHIATIIFLFCDCAANLMTSCKQDLYWAVYLATKVAQSLLERKKMPSHCSLSSVIGVKFFVFFNVLLV